MRNNPREKEIYKHFKGNMYQILTVAKDCETGEELVVYRALYGDGSDYVRPLANFMSPVDKVKYPDAKQEYRFEKVDRVIDPGIEAFLDEENTEERMKILAHLYPRLTDSMINTMAFSLDLDIKDGPIDQRYDELMNCLATRAKYETNRLR